MQRSHVRLNVRHRITSFAIDIMLRDRPSNVLVVGPGVIRRQSADDRARGLRSGSEDSITDASNPPCTGPNSCLLPYNIDVVDIAGT